MLWYLAAALSASVVLVFLAGSALAPFLEAEGTSPTGTMGLGTLAGHVATCFFAGILAVFSLFLILRGLYPTAVAATVLAGVGLASLSWRAARGRLRVPAAGGMVVLVVALIVFGVLVAITAAFTPIQTWDARSIWFFQAKIIYVLEGLHSSPIWTAPEYRGSAFIQPKLIPVLGTLLPSVLGVWNEFIPKAGLILLMVPVVAAALAFSSGRLLEWFLLLGFLLLVGDQLHEGMADGYFAMFGALGVMFLARHFTHDDSTDFTRGVLALGIAACLKPEGYLLWAAAILATFAVCLVRRKGVRLRLMHVPALVLALAPTVLWWFVRLQWGLENSLHLNVGPGMLAKLIERRGEIGDIVAYMVGQTGLWRSIAYAAAVLVLGLALLRTFPPAVAYTAGVAVLYFAGLACIYGGTSADLTWMLDVSADRTVLLVVLLLLAVSYVFLDSMVCKVQSHLRNAGR